jgi:ABC-type glycerol-3-phosphate transport system substrate-binding protein
MWVGQADIAAWEQVVELFKAVAPDVEVKFEPYQFEQYWQKYNTQLAAGDAPAVGGMHAGLVYNYAEKNQLTELGALAKRDEFPLDQLFDNLVEEGRWPKTGDAGLYMLPWRFVGSAFYVNKTLLDERGIPVPEDGWTWDDWVQIAKEVRDEGAGVYGSSLPGGQLQQAQFMQAGAYGPLDPTLRRATSRIQLSKRRFNSSLTSRWDITWPRSRRISRERPVAPLRTSFYPAGLRCIHPQAGTFPPIGG